MMLSYSPITDIWLGLLHPDCTTNCGTGCPVSTFNYGYFAEKLDDILEDQRRAAIHAQSIQEKRSMLEQLNPIELLIAEEQAKIPAPRKWNEPVLHSYSVINKSRQVRLYV